MALQTQIALLISCFKTHNTVTGTTKSLLAKVHVCLLKGCPSMTQMFFKINV
jgi:hypothetical protein